MIADASKPAVVEAIFRLAQNSNYHAAVVDGMEQSNNPEQQVQASEPTAVPQGTFSEQRLCP